MRYGRNSVLVYGVQGANCAAPWQRMGYVPALAANAVRGR
jgi:hypothetical protein